MKQNINEIKRMQQLAGIINESQLNEAENILTLIQDYISNMATLDQGYDYDEDEIKAEQESIKLAIIKAKGAEYFENVKDFAQASSYNDEYAGPEESSEIESQMEELAQELGYTIDQLRGR